MGELGEKFVSSPVEKPEDPTIIHIKIIVKKEKKSSSLIRHMLLKKKPLSCLLRVSLNLNHVQRKVKLSN